MITTPKLKNNTLFPTVLLNLNQLVNVTVKRFGEEHIIVSLEMAHRCDSESAVPPVVLVFRDNKTSELTVNYNTFKFYNVSVTAMLCNHEVANTYIDLHFGKINNQLTVMIPWLRTMMIEVLKLISL